MEELRLKVHSEYRGRLESSLQSAYDQFDKAILTLSSGALGVSIAFIKDVVPLARASWKPLLVCSWVGFALAILSTVVSFLVSQKAFVRQISDAEDYFIGDETDALQRKNRHAMWVQRLNVTSVVLFMLAVGLTIIFISANILEGQPK